MDDAFATSEMISKHYERFCVPTTRPRRGDTGTVTFILIYYGGVMTAGTDRVT